MQNLNLKKIVYGGYYRKPEIRKFNENLCLEDNEDSSITTNYQRDIAMHVIVYIVRGLFSKLCYHLHILHPLGLRQSNFSTYH